MRCVPERALSARYGLGLKAPIEPNRYTKRLRLKGVPVTERPKRALDRLSDPDYLSDLQDLPIDDLRNRRAECSEVEEELSYARRLLQGKLDILFHEITRRTDGGESSLESLIAKLPTILADEGSTSVGRHMNVELPKNFEMQRREVERVASESIFAKLPEMESKQLEELAERLTQCEAQISEERRTVQDVLDVLNSEVVRRYREGQQDVSSLLST